MILFLLILLCVDHDYKVEKEAIVEFVVVNSESCNNSELTIYSVDNYHIPECRFSGKVRN